MPSQQLKECPARKLVAGLPTRVSGSAGHIWIGAVVPEADLAAALSAPCPCEEERLKLLGALQCSNAAAKRRDTIIETLRRRIHRAERHNQFFERCESGWCNPSPKEDPATEGVGMAWKTPAEYEAERDSLRAQVEEHQRWLKADSQHAENQRLQAELSASQERERLLREALQPFAAHYIRMMELLMEPNGYSYMNERIKDWFGVSDFKTAAALATRE